MLRSLNELERCQVSATDGEIGTIRDFLLDNDQWTVRYLVVATSGFCDRQQVLISPISFRRVDWTTKQFHLALMKDTIKMSPNIDANKPVSRRDERDYSGYYGYPAYWGDSGLWGRSDYPGSLAADKWREMFVRNVENSADVRLWSAVEIRGFRIYASDDAIGDVEDLIIDDQTWEVRFIIVDTSSWWSGEKVLVAPKWAARIGWDEKKVYLDLPRQLIKNCPHWNMTLDVNREYQTQLYEHYGRTLPGNHWNQTLGSRASRIPTSQVT